MQRSFLALVIFFATHISLSAAPKLNVVVIMADDLGWADLGCYGSKYHRTPNLDRFAEGAVRFTHGYAAAPVCSPTRAALLTGKHPARLNITDWLPGRPYSADQRLIAPVLADRLPAEEKTIAQILKADGYVTGLFGKWHLGGNGAEPDKYGFDVNVGGDHTGTAVSYFAPYQDKNGRFMPGLEKAPEGEYLTDRLTIEAEKFIESNRDKPFFLYMPHYTVHLPLKAKPELIAKYKPGNVGAQGNPIYAAMLESLDESVGRILKKLDDLKLADHTLVIFTSDNGGVSALTQGMPPTSNLPLREGKGFLYEGGLRVPLIVRLPGVTKAGAANAEPVCLIDLLPTILAACGIKNEEPRDGISLLPMLKGEPLTRDFLAWHYPHYHNGMPGAAIRSGDWKLIEYYENGRKELFDLKKSPNESQNLAESQPEMVKMLSNKLEAWRKQVGAKAMMPNPDYTPNPPAKSGEILLHSRSADIHGPTLRYEPAPHKLTLGYWTRAEDWASWEFTVVKPGEYKVEILQGCGKGSGGSDVELSVDKQVLKFVVEDTGGFQNFKARDLGTLTFDKPGRYVLELRPKKKAGAAVMDVRSITLMPSR